MASVGLRWRSGMGYDEILDCADYENILPLEGSSPPQSKREPAVLEGSLLPACLTGNYLIDSSLLGDLGADVRSASVKLKSAPCIPSGGIIPLSLQTLNSFRSRACNDALQGHPAQPFFQFHRKFRGPEKLAKVIAVYGHGDHVAESVAGNWRWSSS